MCLLLPAVLVEHTVSAQAPASLPGAQQILAILNQSLDWHRRVAAEEQIATEPADITYLGQDRQISIQALKLSFEFARAAADATASSTAPATAAPDVPAQYQSLAGAAARAQNTLVATRAELQSARNKLETAEGRQRKPLQATVSELEAELELAQARAQSLRDILRFVNIGSAAAGGLRGEIDELEKTVPELQAQQANTSTAAATTTVNAAPAAQARSPRPEPSGVLALITDLFELGRKQRVIEDSITATEQLSNSLNQLRSPLTKGLIAAARQGEELAKQADTSNAAELEQLKDKLDAVTAEFKRFSAFAVPLGQENILLGLYKNNLGRWRDSVRDQRLTELRALVLRMIVFAIIVGIALALSAVWQRAIFRYVHDARRRYQFLLLRRIVLWVVIALTIAFMLASELGSLATFAGLITAGIAVALQNVILAVAGYFFLIGRYGVRAGDRVQISGITGEVVDVGLFRLHLMELSGPESARQPTGRVVVFSNSIVFQPTASFFKQIPGTNFVWHEVSLTLAPDTDYRVAEERMLAAVEKVYGAYKDKIEQQHRHMEQTLNLAVTVPQPQSRLRITETGLQMVVRYPVDLDASSQIDDQVTRELLAALGQPPRLKLVGTGTPNIQTVEPPAPSPSPVKT